MDLDAGTMRYICSDCCLSKEPCKASIKKKQLNNPSLGRPYPHVLLQAGTGHGDIGHGHVVHGILSPGDTPLRLHAVQNYLWANNPTAKLQYRNRKSTKKISRGYTGIRKAFLVPEF